MNSLEKLSDIRCFGGQQQRYQHHSSSNNCTMTFSVFIPAGITMENTAPVLYWLSGLTCNDENFIQKAGAQQYAAEHGIILVAPDTSPRGEGVADDPEGHWDFGLGAGFYVNATQSPWSAHYHMFDYITQELPALIKANFPSNGRASISGHSMGGHGALVCALKTQNQYLSASAFAPIVNPTACPWGHKAFGNYLGEDQQQWREYDTCELIKKSASHEENQILPILIDQGEADNFLGEQLLTNNLKQVCEIHNVESVSIRMQEGYDHSYFFIASFIESHIVFHAQHLKSA